MTARVLKAALVGAITLLTSLVSAAPREPEPPKAEREAKQEDNPLPAGAKMRFGVSRPILRTNPAVGLVPPGYTTMLAPTVTGGVRPYDVKTGRPLDKEGVVGPGHV